MTKRKYIIILTPVISLFLLIALVLIFIQSGKSQTSNNTDIPSVSIPIQSEQNVQAVSFKLNEASIDINNPYTDTVLNFESTIETDGLDIEIPKPNRGIIKGDGFVIEIFAGGEGNPFGLETPIPDYEYVNSQLSERMVRIDTSKYNSNRFVDYNLTYSYSASVDFGKDCGENFTEYYCGSYFLRTSEIEGSNYTVTCAVNDMADLKYCDDFIQDLAVSVE